MRPGRRPRGYTLVAVLVLLAVCMLGLALAGPVWSETLRRQHEQDLLRIGALYARAIAAYRAASPGLKEYPQQLEDLLLDSRFVGVARHMRVLYPDPVNASRPWVVIRDLDGRVVGVRSGSDATPVASMREIRLDATTLKPARRYSDWAFLAAPEADRR